MCLVRKHFVDHGINNFDIGRYLDNTNYCVKKAFFRFQISIYYIETRMQGFELCRTIFSYVTVNENEFRQIEKKKCDVAIYREKANFL